MIAYELPSFDKYTLIRRSFTFAFQQLTIIKGVSYVKNHMPFHNHFRALSVRSIVMVQVAPFDPNP